MTDKPFIRGIYYFDLVAAALLLLISVLARFLTLESPSPAVAGGGADWLILLLAGALLIACRRRAYTQPTPWVVLTFAALTLVGIAVIFWQSDTLVLIALLGGASLLLVAGLILRTRRVLEPLPRTDLFTLIVLAGGVCIALALTEVFLRLGAGLFDEETRMVLRGADMDNLGVPHPYIGYLHTPSNTLVLRGRDYHAVHHVDAHGFRNSWPWPERADIVAIGDSMTFGQNVEDGEAWPYLVAQNMAPRRLINLGLIGAGPQQYLRVYETFGVALRPKLLLVGIFARNDFWDADAFDRWEQSGLGGNFMVWRGLGQPPPLRFSVTEPRDTLDRLWRSIVVPTARRSYTVALLRALRGGIEGEAASSARVYSFPDGKSVQLFEADFLNKTSTSRPGRRPFRLVLNSLQEIHSLASKHGARVLMILLPGKEEVHLPLLGVATPDPTSALRSEMDKLGLEYVNLAPEFRARAEAGERLFYEVDGHPNAAGQALIARLVQEHIRENAARYGLAD